MKRVGGPYPAAAYCWIFTLSICRVRPLRTPILELVRSRSSESAVGGCGARNHVLGGPFAHLVADKWTSRSINDCSRKFCNVMTWSHGSAPLPQARFGPVTNSLLLKSEIISNFSIADSPTVQCASECDQKPLPSSLVWQPPSNNSMRKTDRVAIEAPGLDHVVLRMANVERAPAG